VRHLWRAGRTLFAILVGAVLALAFASPAGAAIASTPAITVQQGATCAYDTPAHVYDAPARLSSPDTVATDVRGSPPGLGDVSWGRSVSVARGVVAAEDGSVPARDVHGADRSGRGVDVQHVQENGHLYYQDDGQLVRVLDNGNGTSDVVVRDPSNPSGAVVVKSNETRPA
jgi:hypothetical protein